MDLPRIIGHRGAAAQAPENTLVGLRRAAALELSWVEFDVKLTADNHCILFHDETLERTTDGSGAVADTTYDAISRLDAGSWFAPEFAGEAVPRLDAALDQVLDLGLHAAVEIKPCRGREVETAQAVMTEVMARWPRERPPPLIASFEAKSLAVALAVAPEWPRVLNCFRVPRGWRKKLAALDCRILACIHRRLTRRNVARLSAAGVTVIAFTVNEPARAAELFDWGVSTIVSDAPNGLLAGG